MSFSQQHLSFSTLKQFLSMIQLSIWEMHFPINKHLILLTWLLWRVKYLKHFWIQSRDLQHLTRERQSGQLTQCGHLIIHAGKAQDQGQRRGREFLKTCTLENKEAKKEVGISGYNRNDKGKKTDVQNRFSSSWKKKKENSWKGGNRTVLSLISSCPKPYMQYMWDCRKSCLDLYRR